MQLFLIMKSQDEDVRNHVSPLNCGFKTIKGAFPDGALEGDYGKVHQLSEGVLVYHTLLRFAKSINSCSQARPPHHSPPNSQLCF